MLPSVPEEGGSSGRNRGLVRAGRARPGWLLARDAAGASAGSALAGLAVSLGAHSSIAGVIAGGAIWVVACAGVALKGWLRSFRRSGGPQIDPWALPEPWRGLVRDAVNAGRRFEVATASLPAGPIRDRVAAMEPAVAKQVRAVWDSARRGAVLSGGYPPGTRREPASSLSERMQALQDERVSLGSGTAGRRAELDRAEDALASQLREVKRADAAAAWLQDGLRSSIARLEAAVTSLAELASQPAGGGDVDTLGTSIESVTDELSALQAGLSEVSGSLPATRGLPVRRRKP
ncbi:MAG TPA: hypothetical protein VNF71_08965 [Acidimicrobiales bacterium]|nr:hypothetical protein [Acidimicrobiales bacterium]